MHGWVHQCVSAGLRVSAWVRDQVTTSANEQASPVSGTLLSCCLVPCSTRYLIVLSTNGQFFNSYGLLTNEEYLMGVASSKFIFCPPGFGWDSYRVWVRAYMHACA